jgi:Lrp/AsnC family leucine-responsive transcriptional regulator
MDQIDRKILSLFQNDTRRTAESIGADVGLSAAAVQRRLKRLREEGTIRAEIAELDGAALGVPITCIVTLSMAAPPKHLDDFKREMRALAEVQQIYHVTGSNDFVLVVTAASMEAYGKFARAWFEMNKHIARYETHVVLDRVKTTLTLPLIPRPEGRGAGSG